MAYTIGIRTFTKHTGGLRNPVAHQIEKKGILYDGEWYADAPFGSTDDDLLAICAALNENLRQYEIQCAIASGAAMIINGRGKAMVKGGRRGVAWQARFLRRSGGGNTAAKIAIKNAKLAYVQEIEKSGWTAGQIKHNRFAVLR